MDGNGSAKHMNFNDFFRNATSRDPYRFQTRFATEPQPFDVIRAPTGSGKTATAVLGWLWRRRFHEDSDIRAATPRRLVYCLPMRTLVEQTVKNARDWLKRLELSEEVGVHKLLGGDTDHDWALYPERDAVLVGTQDMLLSRALNRGYAASRFRWPIDFGLLSNDCLWVFDELQLMANGVATSAQLAGLRTKLDTFGPCPSVWMSATMERSWLDTIDLRDRIESLNQLRLDDDELTTGELGKRMTAKKILWPAGLTVDATDKKGYPKAVAEAVAAAHGKTGQSLTLVVLNTVDRAKAVFEALRKTKGLAADLRLIHSRFRPAERAILNEVLTAPLPDAGRIIVATQVVEAGVDISARTLFTELAPWPSLVQRFGRCHRYGELPAGGQIYWLDLPDAKVAPPYGFVDLAKARGLLEKLAEQDVSPTALEMFQTENGVTLPFEHKHVVRRRDVLDLFDTAPDLSGNDIDVSRFVRDDDPDIDVRVFWRQLHGDAPNEDTDTPSRDELCPAPFHRLQEFLKKLGERGRPLSGYIWDHLDEKWISLKSSQVRPGLVILLPATAGGYSWDGNSGLGWDPDTEELVVPVSARPKEAEEGVSSDPNSALGGEPLTVAQHTDHVCVELADILMGIGQSLDTVADCLAKAARWHDTGKAHAAFQGGVRKVNPTLPATELWAKSGKQGRLRYERTHFRHELASTLAALQYGLPYMTAYLVGTHHGRVRLSIRSLPGEDPPDDPKIAFALGVIDGDVLPAVDLGGGESCPSTLLDLSPMRLGGELSWSGRALKLLAEWGPFRLAYLEALLRAADVRASKKEAGNA